MLDTKDNCATCANQPITAERIIKDLLTVADMADFSENLHEMFLSFVRDYDCEANDYKNRILNTYVGLRDHLQQIENFQKTITKCTHQ